MTPGPGAAPPSAADLRPDADADAVDRADLLAAASGDRRAFERLYRRYHPRLARFLRRFSARADLIDDVVNDTMWVVWRQSARFRGASKVSTWIIGIAYRCMLKALRDAPPRPLEDADVDVAGPETGVDPCLERERRDWLQSGLRTLPEELRATLQLAYFLGLSCEEIAEVMGCAVGTVKARMFHARVRLRHVMPALGGSGARAAGAAT